MTLASLVVLILHSLGELIASGIISTDNSALTSSELQQPITPFQRERAAPIKLTAPLQTPQQPPRIKLLRTERSYVGLEPGITTSMHFGGRNFAVAGNYLDGMRNAELSTFSPGISLMASGVFDIPFNKDVGLQLKAGYRQHKARATGISPAGNISGNEPQLENDVYFTWDHFGVDALIRLQLAKNGIYVIGGFGYSSLLSNYVLGTQTFEDGSGNRTQMNFEGELDNFYNSTRFDAKIGIGTWLPLGENGLMIAPELVFGIPLTSLYSETTSQNYQSIDREVNNMIFATIGFALKVPITSGYAEEKIAPVEVSNNTATIAGATAPLPFTATISGRVIDGSGQLINEARLTIVDLKDNRVVSTGETINGMYNVKVNAPGRYSVTADAPGYLFGSALYEVDKDGRILKSSGDIKLAPSSDGRVRLLVFFDFDKATLQSASYPELNRAVALMKANPNMRVEIAGFTDAQGTDSYNKDLSQRRANAVREYLVRQGVEALRLTAVGYGEENPVSTNDTEDGRADNRRVEFVVVKR